MMRGNFIPMLALVLLAGCSSPEERARKRAEKEIAECTKRGLTPDTAAFESCRLQIRESEQKRREERMRWDEDDGGAPASSYRVYNW